MTYDDLAERLGIRLCPACDQGNHRVGFVRGGQVHWSPRRIHRPGLRNFLKLVVESWLGIGQSYEPEKTYWKAMGAESIAKTLGVRFPRRYAELDRARVRAGLPGASLPEETRRHMERWSRD